MVNSALVKVVATARAAEGAADADADDDVWYADARAGFAADFVGGGLGLDTGIDAVAIDNRERTRSSGYVVPRRRKNGRMTSS